MSLKAPLACLLAAAGIAPIASARADIGSDTASLLTMMYNDTRTDCGSPTRPAFTCSGVLVRATQPTTAYQFYSISPNSQATGGVSVSYLRKDAKFQRLAFNMSSGFIFDTVLDNPTDHIDYQVLCSFPIDSGTYARKGVGACGDYLHTTQVERFCNEMGIQTAEQFIAAYRNNTADPRGSQCAFDVRMGQPNTANAFYQSLRAVSLLGEDDQWQWNGSQFQENEIMIAPWVIDPPRSPSILAAFYTEDKGIRGAQINQIQWYQASKRFLPMIRMTMPNTRAEEVTFAYAPESQVILPTTQPDSCTRYIQSATWLSDNSTLAVVPTDCGRRVQENQTNNFVNELIVGHYLHANWADHALNRADGVASMRRQVICHFMIYRDAAVYNIEPRRRLGTQAETNTALCNLD